MVGRRPWQPQDLMIVALLNVVGALAIGWGSAAAGGTEGSILAVGPANAAVLGVVAAALGNALFLLSARRAVRCRISALLKASGTL